MHVGGQSSGLKASGSSRGGLVGLPFLAALAATATATRAMDDSLDKTTLSTIGLLEARLLRLEHIVYGPAGAPDAPPRTSAVSSLLDLERRFARLVDRTRVYGDLLNIYKKHPDLFASTDQPISQDPKKPPQPPTRLGLGELRAVVLASAASFPATASALAASVTGDVPVPDAALSAALGRLLRCADAVADAEARANRVEAALRREEGRRAKAAAA
ncbi:RO10 [Gaeumannomyces tritici R3-111a-1]|uniref:RO10 n=1 Tax=Gaeumannomyces tritici (strain R3-111a-1) TaxID=644352 RepID=J3PES2_GAET3|nr:RO10 [Gaeumannomyces tritici R3-111a-1]EJT70980.1 RO10 [Gaeumannomyces tritici R3-111a-1]